MPTRLSKILGVTRKALEEKGVYDATVDFDSHLHIDPALLAKCKIPEFRDANEKVAAYFNRILLLLSRSSEKKALWRAAVKMLTFGEGLNTGLGYSEKGVKGSGIGPETAERIATTAKEIIDAGISDPTIFDLVPVFEDRIGPDRISDMISKILSSELHAYTNRIAKELGVNPPVDRNGNPFVFIPKRLLSDLPIAEQWEDVEVAALYNEQVREAISSVIGKSWKQIAREYSKSSLKDLLIKNPELLKELLAKYKTRPGNAYDFVLDHLGILIWDELAKQTADQFALNLTDFKRITAENILAIVLEICIQFKKLIEYNGLVHSLYDANGDKRPERFPQLLFYGIADSYCNANDLDLNREINAGSGALDFKVSQGKAKVNVELKYSSNPKLVEGYEKQLKTYNKAEGVEDRHSVYLILKVNNNQDRKIYSIRELIKEQERQNLSSPHLFIIDAGINPSASKR